MWLIMWLKRFSYSSFIYLVVIPICSSFSLNSIFNAIFQYWIQRLDFLLFINCYFNETILRNVFSMVILYVIHISNVVDIRQCVSSFKSNWKIEKNKYQMKSNNWPFEDFELYVRIFLFIEKMAKYVHILCFRNWKEYSEIETKSKQQQKFDNKTWIVRRKLRRNECCMQPFKVNHNTCWFSNKLKCKPFIKQSTKCIS